MKYRHRQHNNSRKTRTLSQAWHAGISCILSFVMIMLVSLTSAHAAFAVTDDPDYHVAARLSLDANTQVNEQSVSGGFKYYIRVNSEGQKSPTHYSITVTMPADSVSAPNVPNFSDQWGGPHTISTPIQNAQGNWTFTITWPEYDATSGVAIPVSVNWKADTPINYKLPISIQYGSDQQPQNTGTPLDITYIYPTPQLQLNGPGTQQGATTYATTEQGVKYITPDDMAPVIFNFSITNQNNLRNISKYDICDILPTYTGADGKQHTAELSQDSIKAGWTLSQDGTTACFTADSSNDKYGEIARNHSLGRSLPQYSIGLNFPYLPMTGTTDGKPSTQITNQAYIDAYANNPADTVVQRTNIASAPQTVVVAGFVKSAGPYKSAPGDFTQTAARKNNPLSWTIRWTNTSNIPATHIMLYDRSTTDSDGKPLANDSRFKISGINQLYLRPRGNYWWPNLTTLAKAGKTVVLATTADGDTDTYPVTWSADGRSANAITFDTSKTYIAVQVVLPEQFALNYGEQINLVVHTQWKDPSAMHYDAETTSNNTVANNADMTAQYGSTGQTSTFIGQTKAETHMLPPAPEKLVLNAFAYNNNLTRDGSDPLLIYDVQAFLDPDKDYKDLRVLAPIPPGFTMTGTHNQNANGLPNTWNSSFVDSWEKVTNYKGTGQDFLIFHINQEAAKEAFALYPRGTMWIEVNGKADFSKSLAGNGANKVVAFFTADNAPVQDDPGSTIADSIHFGPNKNIVFSMGSYTTMTAEGDSFIKGLYGNYVSAHTSMGAGETSMTIAPGKTVYWALSYSNSSQNIRKNLSMFDTAPNVGDVMPVGGQARGTQFGVRLAGKISAVLYNFQTGKTTDYDLSQLNIQYTTDTKATTLTWAQTQADSSITKKVTTMNDTSIPWDNITGFRVDFGDVPAYSRVRLILPTTIPEDIGIKSAGSNTSLNAVLDTALLNKANPTIQSVNAAAFSVDGRDPVQTIPSSVNTSFGSFSFKKVDTHGNALTVGAVKLSAELTGWDGDQQTFAGTKTETSTETSTGTDTHTQYQQTYNNIDHYDWRHMPAGKYVLRETTPHDGYRNTTWEARITVGYKEDEKTLTATPTVKIACVNTAPEGTKGSGGCSVSPDGSTVTLVNDSTTPLSSMPMTGAWGIAVLVGINMLIVLMLGVGIVQTMRRK